jgi:hypothetical protein
MVVTLVLFTVAGVVWLGLRGDPLQERVAARLYRYKDGKGQVVYVDTLEKVPPAQREAAAKEENLKEITTADFDSYVQAFEKKEQKSGSFDWLWSLFSSRAKVTSEPSKKGAAQRAKGQKESSKSSAATEAPESIDGLKSLNPAEVGRSVNSTFESVGAQLEGM